MTSRSDQPPSSLTRRAFLATTGAGAAARQSAGTGVMGGMLAATFLAIFFVSLFFKLVTDRHLSEPRSTAELMAEVRRDSK